MEKQQQAGSMSSNISSSQQATKSPAAFRKDDPKDAGVAKKMVQEKKSKQAKFGTKPDKNGAPSSDMGVRMDSSYASQGGQIG